MASDGNACWDPTFQALKAKALFPLLPLKRLRHLVNWPVAVRIWRTELCATPRRATIEGVLFTLQINLDAGGFYEVTWDAAHARR